MALKIKPIKKLKLYKIRRKSDGLYSSGGSNPRFTREGKTWTKRSLNSHLTMIEADIKYVNDYNLKYGKYNKDLFSKMKTWSDYYKDCELVIFEEARIESLDAELFLRAL